MKPIAITLGDPAGIGPEVAARMLSTVPEPTQSPWVLVGPRWVLASGAAVAGVTLPDYPDFDAQAPAPITLICTIFGSYPLIVEQLV